MLTKMESNRLVKCNNAMQRRKLKNLENVLFDPYVMCLKLVTFLFLRRFFIIYFILSTQWHICSVVTHMFSCRPPFKDGVDGKTECEFFVFCSLKFVECWHILHEVSRTGTAQKNKNIYIRRKND